MPNVIDTHGHILEPRSLWEDYLEQRYRDRAIRFCSTDKGVDYMILDGKPSPYSFGVGPFSAGMGQPYEKLRTVGAFGYFDGPPGAYDPHERLKFMNEEGISKTLIYPSAGLIWGSEVKDVEINAAYTRAYNNWVFDFCSSDRERLIPIGFVPVLDVNEGVKEIRRVAAMGAKGILLFATPLTREGFWHQSYDALWSALEEVDLPAIFHPALNENFFGSQWVTGDQDGITDDRYLLYMESCAVVVDVQGALAQLFQGGVFHRHENLKLLLLETGAGWIHHALERADQKFARVADRSPLKMLPSDYFKRQCWIGMEPDETSVPYLVDIYGDRFVWGTDMPHWDAIPGALDVARGTTQQLSQDRQDAIFGRAAEKLFRI
ncbi:amidohydrolase family protein (plasmid) [Sphingobium sp. SJ10-10]|uniref:amidohydrolase family protein n=1 Tax=Sphingobium sp. SJ10-10 TaxID=3114999 RepID=UPI002E18D33B|nr:amidohydrolase family protein [Sphingobium sp. SJ10-10]